MTQQQKEQIAALRREGYSFTAISDALGISKDTIKTHCRRYGLTAAAPVEKNRKVEDGCFCRNCGTPLVQTEGRRLKLFCSDKCRTAWWNSHQNAPGRKAVYQYTCVKCGKPFTVYGNAHRKYCSHSCYIADRFGEVQA